MYTQTCCFCKQWFIEIISTYVKLFHAPRDIKLGQEDVSGGSLDEVRIIDKVPTEFESLQGRKNVHTLNIGQKFKTF